MALTYITQPTGNSYHFAGDPLMVKVHSDVYDPNLRCTAVVIIYINGLSYVTPEIICVPDSSNDFQFNFRKYVTDIFKLISPAIPDPELVALELLSTFMGQAYVYINEVSGDPLAVTDTETTSTFYILRGGTSWEQFPTLDFLSSFQPDNLQLLTWQSTPTRVHINLPYYACFLQPYGSSTWTVEVTSLDKDGNTLGVLSTLSVTAGPNYGVYCIPVGFKGLGLDATGYADQIDRYYVIVRNGATILSELRLYFVDRSFRRSQKQFLFVNSISGLSTMTAEGEAEYSLTATQQVVNRYLPGEYDVSQGENIALDSSIQHGIKTSSGPSTHKKVMEDSEILSSLNVWELLTFPVTGGSVRVWVPIRKTGTNNKIRKDNDFQPVLNMEYVYAWKNNFFSPKL